MSAELDRDLGAWAREELTREQLLAVHGSAAATIVAVHDRLSGAAAAVAVPAAEAGWASLLARIDAPVPVIPLHRPRARRTLSIAVAAALAVAGIAYAAASRGSHGGSPTISPAPSAPTVVRPSPVGARSNDRRTPPAPKRRGGSPSAGAASGASGGSASAGSGASAGAASAGSGASSSPGESGTTTRGVDGGGGGGGAAKPGDDPHDRDQGTGNDGPHNDHGSGNNGPEGSRPPHSHGH